MKFGFKLFINIVICIFSLVAYGSAFVPTDVFWIAGFLSMTIPFFLLANLVMALFWLVVRPFNAFFSLIVLLIGLKFIEATVGMNFGYPIKGADFRVLSYNVRVFNTYYHLADKDHASSKKMLKFVKTFPAEILCLQEFYNDGKSDIFNSVQQIKKAGFKEYYFSRPDSKRTRERFGMAIFSKYPIIKKGEIDIHSSFNNQIIYADVKFPAGVIRVYNIHLQSMSINEKELNTDESQVVIKRNIISVFKKLRNGFILRSRQVQQLEEDIASCPYPVIVCGDLNDLPYSNTYYRLSRKMQNAFEEAGKGLGISYGGKIPFLRIDNQFVDKRFKVHSYQTHYDITYSDHYPISASYSLQ
jgi:endonuclease/exonuclease/phosphatase family metal-dependent hydrolase